MRRLKIGIRPQLIVLVCFASLFSLLILGIVTGLYFSTNLTQSRSERLYVISQLKSTQVEQALAFIAYQVGTLSSVDAITTPLSQYRAGNNSNAVFSSAQNTLDQYMSSTETFAAARLYNLDLQVSASSYNNATIVSQATAGSLFPLLQNSSIPPALLDSNGSEFYFTGPLANDSSDIFSPYFIGVTLPVYSNSSIIIDKPYIAGYLSIIASAQTIRDALNSTSEDYNVIAVKPLYGNLTDIVDTFNSTERAKAAVGFQTVFPVANSLLRPGEMYNINSSTSVRTAIRSPSGTSTNVKSYSGESVAIGFRQIMQNNLLWSIIVIQEKSVFNAPVNKLKKIIIGVMFAIAVFMCLITFPLAVWFIRPITQLQDSAEYISKYRKERILSEKIAHDSRNNSVTSTTTSSTSGYSTGMQLPARIKTSKKFFKDELTELSEAFNIMTEELDKQYTLLEERVKLRTRELEASKIQAEAANEAKTVFIANISHELRTPLNGILGMTSIAMEEEDEEKLHESLKLIYRSGELLLHILTELLTYSKNTLNRSKLEKSKFQILEIVYQINSIFNKLAVDQRVNFKIVVKPCLFRKMILYGDSNRIIQIIMNLVSNALKFTPVDGSVDVIFRLLGKYDYDKSAACDFKKVCLVHDSKRPFPFNYNTDTTLVQVKDSTSSPGKQADPKKRNSGDFDDTSSIVTLSTIQYENALFEQQFSDSRRSPSPRSSLDKLEEEGSDAKSEYMMPQAKDFKTYHTLNKKEKIEGHKSYKIKNIHHPKQWVIQIEVRDTGSGIEPALQEKVFEPFVQGDQTLSRSYGGTGLGLSICRQLASMMKGTLTVKSAVGEGSTFTLTIPLPQTGEIMIPPEDLEALCDDEFNPNSKMNRRVVFEDDIVDTSSDESKEDTNENSSSLTHRRKPSQKGLKLKPSSIAFARGSTGTAQKSDNHGSGTNTGTHSTTPTSTESLVSTPLTSQNHLSNIKILVAEDNQVNQEVIKRMLKLEGFTNLVMAANGAEAVEMIQQSMDQSEEELVPQQFDLVFMDIQMPIMDGITAVGIIRQKLHFTNPIIALTAFADESNIKECLSCGMNGFLSKPIKRNNLRNVITKNTNILLHESVITPMSGHSQKSSYFS
ncbi:SLN1 [Candida margitis]|uniref:SLN1 n=1 Tax=Candida margitis TaxID=1775924 RepID=UPI0022261B9D|nr:SLN1 [Candida margitis]KAI5969321.1 SLN1 [Candida margitis]